MPIQRNTVDDTKFNKAATLPFELRLKDFELAIQDVYDFFFDVNTGLVNKGLERLDDFLRPAIMSGLLSDMLTASLAKHSRALTENCYFNGHPDLVLKGRYADDCVKAGTVYQVDNQAEPVTARAPLTFTEVYLGKVGISDFRKNARSELGTRTATLHKIGIEKLRVNWVYRA